MTVKALVRDGDGASTIAPLVDHLRELRRRIVLSLLAVAIGSILSFSFADPLITLLRSPLGAVKLYFNGVGDAFGIRMQLGLIGGIALAMPILLWQAWAFISPGLTRS